MRRRSAVISANCSTADSPYRLGQRHALRSADNAAARVFRLLKRQAVVHVGGQAGVRLGCVVFGVTADDGEDWDFDPADAIVFVLEAADLQPDNRVLVRMRSLHAIVMPEQRAN